MKYCMKCNKKIDADIKFCPDCGTKLAFIKVEDEEDSKKKCPSCGFVQESHFKYCVKCGKSFQNGEVSKENLDKKPDPKKIEKNKRKASFLFKKTIIFFVLILVSLGFTYLVQYVDVSNEGRNGTSIGLSTMNVFYNKFVLDFSYSDLCYKVSKYLGYVPFVFAVFFALLGFIELIKNKSLKKVDFGIYMIFIAYILVALVYFYYEKHIINYRPVFEADGTLEASFPSSHTLFSISLCGTAVILNNRLVSKKEIFKSKF